MQKETGILAILVCLLLVMNTTFIILIQLAKAPSEKINVVGNLIRNDPLEIFSKEVLEAYAPTSEPEEAEKETITEEPTPETAPETTENIEIVRGDNGFEMIVNYDKMTITVYGKEIPIIVDEVIGPVQSENRGIIEGGQEDASNKLDKSPTAWVHLPYERFDVYIDDAYYANNGPAITDFFNKFEPRYELMEQQTGWSSEEFYGVKLKINVTNTVGCYGGYAMPGSAVIWFSDPLYKPGCERPYYEQGIPYFGNPGELGDWWGYMNYALHESLHSINHLVTYDRLWLTEGFSEYNMYNIIVDYGDINQETADTYIYAGQNGFIWEEYANNDYRDGLNKEIQLSAGYDITAWMFSMMRDNHNLDWASFYNIFENNEESLMKAAMDHPGAIDSDMVVIDVFSRASSIGNFEAAKPVWRYDSPSGPGWGVRQWENLNWYADLSPFMITFSKANPKPGDTITINTAVYNYGQTPANNVSVRFYNGSSLIEEKFANIQNGYSAIVSTQFTAPEGTYTIRVVADEPNIKFETNESNNEVTRQISFSPMCGDVNGNGAINILDATHLIGYLYKAGAPPVCNSPYFGCADVNGNGVVNILDVTYLIGYLYKSGPAPSCSMPSTATTPGVPTTYYALDKYIANLQKTTSTASLA